MDNETVLVGYQKIKTQGIKKIYINQHIEYNKLMNKLVELNELKRKTTLDIYQEDKRDKINNKINFSRRKYGRYVIIKYYNDDMVFIDCTIRYPDGFDEFCVQAKINKEDIPIKKRFGLIRLSNNKERTKMDVAKNMCLLS